MRNILQKRILWKKRQVGRLLWATRGRFIVMYALPAGVFEFYDAETKSTMAKDRHHDMCTHAQWDPTGRYLVTYVSGWRAKTTELGFKIWNLRGTEIFDKAKSGFYQFMWRPRPPSLLTAGQRKELEEKYSNYAEKYKKVDELIQDDRNEELKKARQKQKDEFIEYMLQKKKEHESDVSWRSANGIKEIHNKYVEEVHEAVVNVKEEIQ